MINKGFISSFVEGGKKAVVIPQEASDTVTFPLVVPYFLLECLEVNMPVVYSTFPDNTGIILARLDGEWNHKIYETLTVEGTTHITEHVTADSGITATGGISAAGGGNVTVQGNITLEGSLTATGGISAGNDVTAGSDVKAGAISLSTHVHGGIMKGDDKTEKAQ